MCGSGESVFLLRLLTLEMADSTCPSWHDVGGSWSFPRGLSDFPCNFWDIHHGFCSQMDGTHSKMFQLRDQFGSLMTSSLEVEAL